MHLIGGVGWSIGHAVLVPFAALNSPLVVNGFAERAGYGAGEFADKLLQRRNG